MADGGPLTDAGDLVSDGLDLVGLHTAADAVDGASDGVVDWLGGDVAERSLDDTGDPRLLVHGDPSAIGASTTHLRRFADAFARTADGLRSLDVRHWSGAAGDAFRKAFDPQPSAWFAAADACARAASALDGFAAVVGWAQGQAAQAVQLHRLGVAATDRARSAYANQLSTYHLENTGYLLRRQVGLGDGPAPVPPVDPGDPGLAQRRRAQEVLDRARSQRDAAALQAQQALSAATATAPPPPSAGDRATADLTAWASAAQTQGQHVIGGFVKGAGAMVSFVRGLDPLDPYNVSHPARYVDTVSTTVAGLGHAVAHPTEVVTGLLGTQWGSDPGEALGRLTANVAADVVTGGGALTATGAARVAARSAEHTAVTGTVRTTRAVTEEEAAAAELRRARTTPPPPPIAAVDAQAAAELENLDGSTARIREALDGPRPDPRVAVAEHTTPPPEPVHAVPTPPRADVAPVADTATDTSAITRALDGPGKPEPTTPPTVPSGRTGRSREGSWTRLARPTPAVTRPAIHAESATLAEADAFIRTEFPQLLRTNSPRLSRSEAFRQNCTHCVVTVDRQLDGSWLEATPRPELNRSLQDLIKSLPRSRGYTFRNYDALIDKMTQLGNGSRGFVLIARTDGSAHVFNVITTRDGVVFLDGQTGTLGLLEKNVTGIWLYTYRAK